jgi:uncharacterized protein with NAD-binding domain and iron-sulfur cluster
VTGLQVQSELKEFDAVVAAVDLPGAKKLIPEPFRVYPEFDRIYELDAVPIATVQLRFDGAEAASPYAVAARSHLSTTQAGSRNCKITKR